jgi:hypothetical protein
MKTLVSILLLVVAAASVPPAAQTLTEQLQRGIYAEETLKNRDEAARIYRRILAAPSVPQAIADEAQRRLARLLLASPPAGALATQVFPEKPRAIADQGKYRHLASGITFDLPAGWHAGETWPSSDGGDQVSLTDEATKRTISVWMIREDVPANQVAEQVAGRPAEKLRQRHSGYGIPGMLESQTYEIPADTVQPGLINGRQAIIAIGRYQGVPLENLYPSSRPMTSGTEPMFEYMTWIDTQKSRAFFFARVPVNDLPLLRPTFDQLVRSAVFP